jgi:phage-related protein
MATFSYVPLYVWESQASHRVLVSTLENGREQRKYKGRGPREWTLSFRATAATIRAIVAFFDARKGSFEAFSWTPPGESASVSVRFKEESLSASWDGTKNGHLASVTFREVL